MAKDNFSSLTGEEGAIRATWSPSCSRGGFFITDLITRITFLQGVALPMDFDSYICHESESIDFTTSIVENDSTYNL